MCYISKFLFEFFYGYFFIFAMIEVTFMDFTKKWIALGCVVYLCCPWQVKVLRNDLR